MTPRERDLTPEEEAEISRLLAEAGGPTDTPPDVVVRLDQALAELVAERGADPGPRRAAADPVTSLAARRRRWPRALLAAAAVVGGGYGLGAALTGTTMSGDAESSTSTDAGAGGVSGGARAGSQSQAESLDAADHVPSPANASLRGPARLRPDHLAADVARLLGDADRRTPADRSTPRLHDPLDTALRGCAPAEVGPRDTWYLVRYDGRRATLVTAPPDDGVVSAVVLSCGGARLDAVTVPAP